MICIAKKLNFNVLIGVQTFHFFKLCKNAKNPKKYKILKNDGHFRIPHPQISFKHFQTFAKIQFFMTMQGGEKVLYCRIFAKQFIKKIKNCLCRFFFYILQLPPTVILNSEKLTHPYSGNQDNKKIFHDRYTIVSIRNI